MDQARELDRAAAELELIYNDIKRYCEENEVSLCKLAYFMQALNARTLLSRNVSVGRFETEVDKVFRNTPVTSVQIVNLMLNNHLILKGFDAGSPSLFTTKQFYTIKLNLGLLVALFVKLKVLPGLDTIPEEASLSRSGDEDETSLGEGEAISCYSSSN